LLSTAGDTRRLYIRKYVVESHESSLGLIAPFRSITAQIFDNFTSVKRFSNRTFNHTFRNNTCLVTLLALRRNLLSNTGDDISCSTLKLIAIKFSYFTTPGTATWCTRTTERCHSRMHGRRSIHVRSVSSEISSAFKQKGERHFERF
jgi:hypothetical protein